MKKLVIISILMATMAACGGGGDSATTTSGNNSGSSTTSTFDSSKFTNGANATKATSEWDCNFSGATTNTATLAFYADGTGTSSAIGAFTWTDVGNNEVDLEGYEGLYKLENLAGSIASGIVTCREITPSGGTVTASCTLKNL